MKFFYDFLVYQLEIIIYLII